MELIIKLIKIIMKHYLTESNLYDSKDQFQTFSVSRIKTYKDCSQMYKLKYVDKLDVFKQSTSTLSGTLLHAALEYFYGTEDSEVVTPEDAYFKILPIELANVGITKADSLCNELLEYYEDIKHLYARASESYTGPDAIRTRNGSVPKAPEMTGVWKAAVKKLNLDTRKSLIDTTIQTSKDGMEDVSIVDVFTKSLQIIKEYTTPREMVKMLSLEMPLSQWDYENNILRNPVPFPGCSHPHVYLNGYIDNICKIRVGSKTYTTIVDYKSSKETFDENIVKHNQQLLLYAAGVEYITGEPVEYIGILSFLQKELIYVPVDKKIQQEVIEIYNRVIDKTIKGEFNKHVPDTKYSQCLSSFGGECPFLKHCWPDAYNYNHSTDDNFSLPFDFDMLKYGN